MKIELCEDNGFMQPDGKPTLVVLVVTQDDGRTLRIPYHADQTIKDLYSAVKNIPSESYLNPVMRHEIKLNFERSPNAGKSQGQADAPAPVSVPEDTEQGFKSVIKKNNEIERQDIVQCFRLEKDIDGNTNPDLEVGKEYRIIDIYKTNGAIQYYDLLDDAAGTMMRINALPSEIQLVRKHVKPSPRVVRLETIVNCDCGEANSLPLDDNGIHYSGSCFKCGNWLIQKRLTNNQKKEELSV